VRGYSNAVVVAASLLFTPFAFAQTFEQMSGLRLTDSLQNVRAASMGSTSGSLDDESSIATNPAAIARLKRTTISVAGSRTLYEYEAFRPTATGLYSFKDDFDATGLSHVSVAFPFRSAAIGLYYAADPEVQSREPLFLTSNASASYVPLACAGPCNYSFYPASTGFTRADRRIGATVAFALGTLDVAAGAELRDLDEQLGIARIAFNNDFVPGSERLFRKTHGRTVVPNVGLMWHAASRLNLSAAYHGGGSFDRTTAVCRTTDLGSPFCSTATAALDVSNIEMPDAARIGGSFEVTRGLVVAAEAVRRNYSKLADEPYSIIGETFLLPYRDVTEPHAGAEYRFGSLPVALRAGWWRDPSRFTLPAFGPVAGVSTIDHVTFGAGVKLAGTDISIAFDQPRAGDGRKAAIGFTHAF
jgi:hypothetical protein